MIILMIYCAEDIPYIFIKEVMIEHVVMAELVLAVELGVSSRGARKCVLGTRTTEFTKGVGVVSLQV